MHAQTLVNHFLGVRCVRSHAHRLSNRGEDTKVKGTRKVPPPPSCSRFLNSVDYLGARNMRVNSLDHTLDSLPKSDPLWFDSRSERPPPVNTASHFMWSLTEGL